MKMENSPESLGSKAESGEAEPEKEEKSEREVSPEKAESAFILDCQRVYEDVLTVKDQVLSLKENQDMEFKILEFRTQMLKLQAMRRGNLENRGIVDIAGMQDLKAEIEERTEGVRKKIGEGVLRFLDGLDANRDKFLTVESGSGIETKIKILPRVGIMEKPLADVLGERWFYPFRDQGNSTGLIEVEKYIDGMVLVLYSDGNLGTVKQIWWDRIKEGKAD